MKNGQRVMLRPRNRYLLGGDIAVGMLTPALALLLRVETPENIRLYLFPLCVYIVFGLMWKLLSLHLHGIYRRDWRYASVEEWSALAKATLSSGSIGIIVFLFLLRPTGLIPHEFPRSLVAIDAFLTILFVVGVRFIVPLAFYANATARSKDSSKRVLLAGAGVAGSMAASEMLTNPHLNLMPIGFVDDDPEKEGEFIHGIQVFGALRDIPAIAARYHIDEVIIAMPTAPGKTIRSVVQLCKDSNIPSRTIPGLFEILGGSAKVSELREVQIDDLLRRESVKYDFDGANSFLKGKRVMVTGAGGSIGSELSRQIWAFQPSELILFGHGENSIFEMAAELKRQHDKECASTIVRTVIADMRDRNRMKNIFRTHSPHVVFHAAAHKHVGLMEDNLPDAVTNNVLGTQILTELAADHNTERFILISSDKAVNPTCVMGVTKRVAELIVCDAAHRTGRAFVTVRFGNVLGSRGSVVPIFKRQIAFGGPITITDPEATRFFMTIPEAAQLVLKAAELGQGSEVFVLDMGQPIKVVSLAHDLIRLSGLEVGKDIEIAYTGLKPGEKLAEELFYAAERIERTQHDKILVAANGALSKTPEIRRGIHEPSSRSQWRMDLDELIKAARDERLNDAHCLLKRIVPEYQIIIKEYEQSGFHHDPIAEREPSNHRVIVEN